MFEKNSELASRRRTWAAKNGDFIAIAVISAFVTVLFYVVVTTTKPRPTEAFNFGFSRDLDCRPVGFLEPVCTKRQTRR
jgi:hypothetical protein